MTVKTRLLWYTVCVSAYLLFMFSMPWTHLQGHEFVDRTVYEQYFRYKESILDYKPTDSVTAFVFNEALWHQLMRSLLERWQIPMEVLFGLISTITLSTFATFLVVRHGALSVLLLVNPLIVTLAFSQLRMALSFSLLLISYSVGRKAISAAIAVAACLLHTASFLFVGFYILGRAVQTLEIPTRSANSLKFALLCIVGVAASVAIGPLREEILGHFGDRRAEFVDSASSFLYTSYWIALLASIWLRAHRVISSDTASYSTIVLSLVTSNLITGGYSNRFLAVSLPILIATMLDLGGLVRFLAVLGFTIYTIAQWVYWLRIPLF